MQGKTNLLGSWLKSIAIPGSYRQEAGFGYNRVTNIEELKRAVTEIHGINCGWCRRSFSRREISGKIAWSIAAMELSAAKSSWNKPGNLRSTLSHYFVASSLTPAPLPEGEGFLAFMPSWTNSPSPSGPARPASADKAALAEEACSVQERKREGRGVGGSGVNVTTLN